MGGTNFITLLGTGGYLECHYYFEPNNPAPAGEFVQCAIVDLLRGGPLQPSKLTLILTPEAKARHWAGGGDKPAFRKDIEERQRRMGFQIKIIDVPSPVKAQAPLEIFDGIFHAVGDNEDVIFDITHSFRYLPLIAQVALHYAQIVKGAEVCGLFYGNLEAAGGRKHLEGLPLERRLVPIDDLGAVAWLQGWLTGVHAFVEAGRAEPLHRWLNELKGLLRENVGYDHIPQTISRIYSALVGFTQTLEMNRLLRLPRVAGEMHRALDGFDVPAAESPELQPAVKPLSSLTDYIRTSVEEFDPDKSHIDLGLAAVAWCIRHGLIQQAYTIAREVIILAVCESEGWDPARDHGKAEKLLNGLERQARNGREHSGHMPGNKLRNPISPGDPIIKSWTGISDYRNDISHAGLRTQPKGHRTLRKKIPAFAANLNDALREYRKASAKPEAPAADSRASPREVEGE